MTDLLLQIGLFIVSLAALLWASDRFVEAAERIGLSLGISPFIIGVTIVAFGTSLPELATSIVAVLDGTPEIVIGNVVGSNITNIALVLGLTAVVVNNIELEYNLWHIDIPFLWGSAFLLYFAVSDGNLSMFESLLFLGGIAIFLAYSLKDQDRPSKEDRPLASWKDYLLLLVGAAIVSLSATGVIEAITNISTILNIAPTVIALSAVAIGTSLPEVAVSLAAARKGKASIAVGNAIGSNVFNTFVVMAIPRFFGPLAIPTEILSIYLPLMIAMTVLIGVMSNNRKITRWEGWMLLLFFGWYLGVLIGGPA
ncbi:calcium/sodium antiporter [Neolewinella lacunae]|uniref:Calcium/sodium antiporter n=1 Tax=Neolewinella lacunae TaxID=1517758 RepID=A0A923T5T2_9BACT|nr:calcium/sodium antiporter [Neolewinella lacunae]MBC6992650.1 calcium/sodium antiporter [Neolewinella lacunae]MDN3633530.1 calcium/sodium antiporter [Neolewinella lacunae]